MVGVKCESAFDRRDNCSTVCRIAIPVLCFGLGGEKKGVRNFRERPICISTKRTQFIFVKFLLYRLCLQELVLFARAFFHWVRFGKRTQFWGSFEAVCIEK